MESEKDVTAVRAEALTLEVPGFVGYQEYVGRDDVFDFGDALFRDRRPDHLQQFHAA